MSDEEETTLAQLERQLTDAERDAWRAFSAVQPPAVPRLLALRALLARKLQLERAAELLQDYQVCVFLLTG
jgi:hypothetical protein